MASPPLGGLVAAAASLSPPLSSPSVDRERHGSADAAMSALKAAAVSVDEQESQREQNPSKQIRRDLKVAAVATQQNDDAILRKVAKRPPVAKRSPIAGENSRKPSRGGLRSHQHFPQVDLSEYEGAEAELSQHAAQISLPQCILNANRRALASLLRQGVYNVEDRDSHGWNAAHWAASVGDVVSMALVIQQIKEQDLGGDLTTLNAIENISGWTPLHIATIGGHVDVVQQLVGAGCDLNVKDHVGDVPLDMVEPQSSFLIQSRLTARQKKIIKILKNVDGDISPPHNSRTSDSSSSSSSSISGEDEE